MRRRTFRVLVTGSRSWQHPGIVTASLDLLYVASRTAGRRMIVRQGGCKKGPDDTARRWTLEKIAQFAPGAPVVPVTEDTWNADWSTDRGGGMRRNQDMVDAGADVCLAFIDNASPGATYCAEAAEKADIVTIYWRIIGEELHWPAPGWMSLVPV